MQYGILILIIFYSNWHNDIQAQPQCRANVWHFGNMEGLSFDCGKPKRISGSKLISLEGASGLCDEKGQLLFYSNCGGLNRNNFSFSGGIWNRNHELMYDLNLAEGGGASSAQGGIIIPKPNIKNSYFLFTVDELESIGGVNRPHRGISYFEIDMSLNNGLGGVTQRASHLFGPAAECITAGKHSNNTDFWILTVDFNTREFISIQVTHSGILYPVRSNRLIKTNPLAIKLSSDGQFLFDGSALYRFDPSTGKLTWLTNITNGTEYGFNFSPKSKFLYIASRNQRSIIRYNLHSVNIDGQFDIIESIEFTSVRHMQTAPDGNIYFNSNNFLDDYNKPEISVIECPDSETPIVRFDILSQSDGVLSGTYTSMSNIADFWFDNLLNQLEKDTTEVKICENKNLILIPNCSGNQYLWSTSESSDRIIITEPGEYRVSITKACFTTVETFIVTPESTPEIDIEYKLMDDFCGSLPLLLTANSKNADTIFWSTNSYENSIIINKGGTYAVTASNTCGKVFASSQFPTDECCEIFTNNIFSPNGDGVNDTFIIVPKRCYFSDFNLKIYSRWGELVFETDDPKVPWDGFSGAKQCISGVYVWQIKYRLTYDSSYNQMNINGDVTLYR
jgi:gliding motility-associated-like protein